MNAKERIRIERKIEDRKRMIQIEEMKRMLGRFFERIDWDLERLCLLYTSPSPRDRTRSRMPSSA